MGSILHRLPEYDTDPLSSQSLCKGSPWFHLPLTEPIFKSLIYLSVSGLLIAINAIKNINPTTIIFLIVHAPLIQNMREEDEVERLTFFIMIFQVDLLMKIRKHNKKKRL